MSNRIIKEPERYRKDIIDNPVLEIQNIHFYGDPRSQISVLEILNNRLEIRNTRFYGGPSLIPGSLHTDPGSPSQVPLTNHTLAPLLTLVPFTQISDVSRNTRKSIQHRKCITITLTIICTHVTRYVCARISVHISRASSRASSNVFSDVSGFLKFAHKCITGALIGVIM